jgi:hypothetical protein
MKYLKFFNESIRDLMTPKSEEEILKSLEKLSPDKILDVALKHNLPSVAKLAIDKAKEHHERIINAWHLKTALYHKQKEMVKLLVDKGVDSINDKGIAKEIFNLGDIEIAKLLIEHGANANKVETSEFYGMIRSGENVEIVKLLVDNSPIMKEKLRIKAIGFKRDLDRINKFIN